jgi:hypothetical protein
LFLEHKMTENVYTVSAGTRYEVAAGPSVDLTIAVNDPEGRADYIAERIFNALQDALAEREPIDSVAEEDEPAIFSIPCGNPNCVVCNPDPSWTDDGVSF